MKKKGTLEVKHKSEIVLIVCLTQAKPRFVSISSFAHFTFAEVNRQIASFTAQSLHY